MTARKKPTIKVTKQVSLTVVNSNEGDWCGLYVDGRLIHQGHDFPIRQLIGHLKDNQVLIGRVEEWEAGDWLQDVGQLPDLLSDVAAQQHEVHMSY